MDWISNKNIDFLILNLHEDNQKEFFKLLKIILQKVDLNDAKPLYSLKIPIRKIPKCQYSPIKCYERRQVPQLREDGNACNIQLISPTNFEETANCLIEYDPLLGYYTEYVQYCKTKFFMHDTYHINIDHNEIKFKEKDSENRKKRKLKKYFRNEYLPIYRFKYNNHGARIHFLVSFEYENFILEICPFCPYQCNLNSIPCGYTQCIHTFIRSIVINGFIDINKILLIQEIFKNILPKELLKIIFVNISEL